MPDEGARRAIGFPQLVIETAFGNEERELAEVSKHLSPAMLATELAGLDGSVPVHITHAKPGELCAVLAEIRAIDLRHSVAPLSGGERFEF